MGNNVSTVSAGSARKFSGTERYVVAGRLGEGGMGVVYRARDTLRGGSVALKTMTNVDAGALLRFKREFRALADIVHPNVVQLFELVSEGDQWFFTMELVDGVDFLHWVRSARAGDSAGSRMLSRLPTTRASAAPTIASLEPTVIAGAADTSVAELGVIMPVRRSGVAVCCDVARLRKAFIELCEGVSAIHGAGKLHCDIKPSNVLVARDGRVVLLDFGVAGEIDSRDGRADDVILGTPAYMAPEQARGHPASPRSDWYAVGVMLYEALTGELPFDGSPADVLLGKQQRLPPPPSSIVDQVRAELDEL
jgi:serine/threonine protein kinase